MFETCNRYVGNGIVKNINKQYGLALTAKFFSINTTDGFFESMKAAVDSGKCDVVVADGKFVKFSTTDFLIYSNDDLII